MLAEVSGQLARDEARVEELRTEIARLDPGAVAAQQAEGAGARRAGSPPKPQLREWQERWEAFNREQGGTYQTTQVERTRIEQLDDQLRRVGHACRPARRGARPAGAGGRRCTALAELETRESGAR